VTLVEHFFVVAQAPAAVEHLEIDHRTGGDQAFLQERAKAPGHLRR